MIREMQELGFTEKEAQIYVLLAREKELSAPKIALLLDIDRRTVYDVINSLFHKGYISRKKVQGKEIFSATNPELIVEEFSEKIKNLKNAIPVFKKAINKVHETYQEVNILYGKRAIQLLVANAIKARSEILLMGRGGHLIEQLGESKHQFISKLKSLNWKMIQTSDYKRYFKKEEFIPREIRYLPEDIRLNVAYIVFDNKLYFFTKKKEIMLIEIVDETFATTFRTYFTLFWNIAKA